MTRSVTKENRTIRVEEYPSLGFWLKRRRKALDLTQAELARRAGCSAATIRKIEADERKPSLQLAELLAEQLQLPAEQVETFVQFARGVAVGGLTGLETLDDSALLQEMVTEAAVKSAESDFEASLAHNLPSQTTRFFGRRDELAALAGYLDDPHKRLVTVLGPGGMGKTRLALAAAEEQLVKPDSTQRFANGIYFVSLAGVASADSLAAVMAEAIDFQFSGADEPQAQLLRYLGTRHMLLVLDNFEHLLTGVRLVQAILDDCPGVEVLVTSREKLKLRSEQLFPIGGLSCPAQGEAIGLEQAAGYSAVQLFIERARSVRPAFALVEDNLKGIVTICRQVEGMPLGIVLAATWIDTLTVDEIAREIGRDLDFLKTELSDVPARQRSLQAAFNYSWRFLSPQEQAIYCQLSVFRGGFSAEAAQEVADASFRDLQALVNKSLLSRSVAAGQPAARYGVHELLRQFAEGELSSKPDLEGAARNRHSAYYLALLQKLEPDWHTGQQLETLATIARESDNITAAWDHAIAIGNWEQLAGAMDSWGQYHRWQGLFADGAALCASLETRRKTVLDSETGASRPDNTLWVKALAWQGLFLSATEEALDKLEESLAFLEGQDPDARQMHRLKAFILRGMAWRLIPVDSQRAHQCAEQALQLSLNLDDGWQVAESHYYLALLNWKQGRLSEARTSTDMALKMFRASGDQRMQVLTEIILGWVTQIEGDFALAERLRYETQDLCRRIGDRPFLIHCATDLSVTLVLRGKLRDALRSAEEGVSLSVSYGFREKEGWARSMLGHCLMHLGQYERARREFERGLKLVKETGNQDVEAGLWLGLGDLTLIPGDRGRQARDFYERGLRLHKQIHDVIFFGVTLNGLLLASCQVGAGDEAREYALEYLEYVLHIRHYEYLVEALAAVSFYLAHFDNKGKALEIWHLVKDQPYIATSKWYEDVIGKKMEALTAGLSPQKAAEATDFDLWLTAESLLADLK